MITSDNISIISETHEDEFLKFDRVENKRHPRRDLHAMLLMAEILPSIRNIISAAEHNKVWFECGELDNNKEYETLWPITEDQVVELLRCGVSFDDSTESFYLFT